MLLILILVVRLQVSILGLVDKGLRLLMNDACFILGLAFQSLV